MSVGSFSYMLVFHPETLRNYCGGKTKNFRLGSHITEPLKR